MKCRQNKRKLKMKIQSILTTIAATVLIAITFNVNAGTTLLSPRSAGNQIKVAAGITTTLAAPTVQAISPRALGNQITTVASVANDVNPVMECHKMIADAKTIQACAANPAGMGGCCKNVMADNTTH
jgi:hypothetical protein